MLLREHATPIGEREGVPVVAIDGEEVGCGVMGTVPQVSRKRFTHAINLKLALLVLRKSHLVEAVEFLEGRSIRSF